MLAGEAQMAQATGSSPALQTYLHPWGPWAWGGGGDRWFWGLPGRSSDPCFGPSQRWASGKVNQHLWPPPFPL